MSEDRKDYEIGYGKPPKATQFKPGESGNSRGRPKGARGLKTDLKAELEEVITITEGGAAKKLTKQQLMLRQLARKAAKGDHRATAKLIDLTIALFGPEEQEANVARPLSPEDEALVRKLRAQFEEDPGDK